MCESSADDPKPDLDEEWFYDEDEDEHERPGDIPNPEWWSVLHTPGGRFRAGKSYSPDPSGSRAAVKAADVKLGSMFFCTLVTLHNLDDVFDLLKDLSGDFLRVCNTRDGRLLEPAATPIQKETWLYCIPPVDERDMGLTDTFPNYLGNFRCWI